MNISYLNIVLSIFLLSGCNSTNIGTQEIIEEPDVLPTLKTLYISGIAIDGEVAGADVTFAGKSVKTDENGKWVVELQIDENIPYEQIKLGEVKISGGIDQSTGEVFEGELKAYINHDDIIVDGKTGAKFVPVTPLTTIINALVKLGMTEAEAERKLERSLGIVGDFLDLNPIKKLDSSLKIERMYAIKAVKKALVVQKFSELMMKSITPSFSSEDEKLLAFDLTMSAIAKILYDINMSAEIYESRTFDNILNNTNLIIEEIISINNKRTENIQILNLEEKLKSIGDVSKSVTLMINKSDEEKFISPKDNNTDKRLEYLFKSIEIITLKTEAEVEKDDEFNLTKLEQTANALIMIGGVNKISTIIEDAKISATPELANGTGLIDESNAVIDASDFSDFLNDEVITGLSEIYLEKSELNISDEDMLEGYNDIFSEIENNLSVVVPENIWDIYNKIDESIEITLSETLQDNN